MRTPHKLKKLYLPLVFLAGSNQRQMSEIMIFKFYLICLFCVNLFAAFLFLVILRYYQQQQSDVNLEEEEAKEMKQGEQQHQQQQALVVVRQ